MASPSRPTPTGISCASPGSTAGSGRSSQGLDTRDIENLRQRGRRAREAILEAEPARRPRAARSSRPTSDSRRGAPRPLDVAVRSSATAEDLPDASFAGQQETYLNVQGSQALLETCKRCFASLFTDRAISYRVDKGFDHFKVGLSIGVQRMVRSDLAASGVMFSIDTETGFRDAVLINASYGLGENVVQGSVNPDEYYVFKPTLKQGFRPILQKMVGTKEFKLVYDVGGGRMTKNVPVPPEDRDRFAIDDDEILALARWACLIEDHYIAKRGQPTPMDMEWAKDGRTGELFIVQARPETVQSQKQAGHDRGLPAASRRGRVLVSGRSVGEKIGRGPVRVIKSVQDLHHVPRRRGPRHRQDRPRLGADDEEGGGHRHQPRRPDLPRGHRQPRARPAGRRRHRARHRAAPRRPGRSPSPAPRAIPASSTTGLLDFDVDASGPRRAATAPDQDHDERRQPRGGVPALVRCPTTASAWPARSSSSPPTSRSIRWPCSTTTAWTTRRCEPRSTA